MSDKEELGAAGLAEPVGPFVRAVRAGDLVAISGTSALSHETGPLEARPLPDDFETQARLTFRNVGIALRDAGLEWTDVVKLMVMLKRRDDYPALNRVRREVLGAAQMASTTFICELIRADMLLEVDAWALVRR